MDFKQIAIMALVAVAVLWLFINGYLPKAIATPRAAAQ